MWLEISKEIDRLEYCPILRGPTCRTYDSIKRIQISRDAILSKKRLIELSLVDEGAAAKGRLSAELLEYKLLDWVIEESPTSAQARFAGVTRAPGDADAGSKRLVISLRHAGLNPFVTRNDQSDSVL